MSQIILDFMEAWPEGKDKKTTKPRGPITLAKYVHTKGSRVEDTKMTECPLWDYEIFESQMESLRKWRPQRCREEWAALECREECEGDMGGPNKKQPKRLRIPSDLVGNEKDQHVESNYEDKSLMRESKGKSMPDSTKQQLERECKMGFQRADASAGSAINPSLFKPLPKNAMTSDSSVQLESGMDVMMKHANCNEEQEPPAQQVATGGKSNTTSALACKSCI